MKRTTSVYCRGAGDERTSPAGVTERTDRRETGGPDTAKEVEVSRFQPADDPNGNPELPTGLPKDVRRQGALSASGCNGSQDHVVRPFPFGGNRRFQPVDRAADEETAPGKAGADRRHRKSGLR